MPNRFVVSLLEERESLVSQLEGYKKINSKIEKIDELLKDYQDGKAIAPLIATSPKSTLSVQNIDWNIVKRRVLEITKEAGAFVKANVFSSTLWGDEATEEIKNRLSNYLGTLEREGKIVKYKHNNNNLKTYWGLPEWTLNKEPLKEYLKIKEAA
jgi:flavorubredoxin